MPTWWTMILFNAVALFGVVGIPQLKEPGRERKRGKSRFLITGADLKAYYIPVWKRMFLWFVGCVLGTVLFHIVTLW